MAMKHFTPDLAFRVVWDSRAHSVMRYGGPELIDSVRFGAPLGLPNVLDCFVTRHFGWQRRVIRHGASAGRFRHGVAAESRCGAGRVGSYPIRRDLSVQPRARIGTTAALAGELAQ